jgi:hypothetical protein
MGKHKLLEVVNFISRRVTIKSFYPYAGSNPYLYSWSETPFIRNRRSWKSGIPQLNVFSSVGPFIKSIASREFMAPR